ncbi:hypothetical protein NEOKW01_1231 [Nematocida sp. AWRm80]|nr:hypothetical protein NEOKW01_1231 [Nematocida sp. AWRm80]
MAGTGGLNDFLNTGKLPGYDAAGAFLYHNKNIILDGIPIDPDNDIIERMSTHGFKPLIKDASTWVFEFIRNMIHISYLEGMYILGIFIFVFTYSTYRKYLKTASIIPYFIMDICLMLPFMLLFIGATYDSKTHFLFVQSFHLLLCTVIILAPRLFLIVFEWVKKIKVIGRIEMIKTGKLPRFLACALAIILAIIFVSLFYSKDHGLLTLLANGTTFTPLYLRECFSGLLIFAFGRAIFLFAEWALDHYRNKRRNTFKAQEFIIGIKTKILIFTVYAFLIIGCINFMYTYYSIGQAAYDTTLVHDAIAINTTVNAVSQDLPGLSLKITRMILFGIKPAVENSFDQLKHLVTDNPLSKMIEGLFS